jgi:hypothetical protein
MLRKKDLKLFDRKNQIFGIHFFLKSSKLNYFKLLLRLFISQNNKRYQHLFH